MGKNLYDTAQSHYAGDIVIIGHQKKNYYFFEDLSNIQSIISKTEISIKSIIKRSIMGEGNLYFNGSVSRLKYVVGVDWESEQDLFKYLKYSERSEEPFSEDSILISSPMAEMMNVQLGDLILLEVMTQTGQVNTKNFKVSGIVDDRSIFGFFKCYIDRKEMNRLVSVNENFCTHLGIYLDSPHFTDQAVRQLHNEVSSLVDTATLVADRNELNRERKENWKGIRYFILPLAVFLSEVSELLLAIKMLSYFLYIMMILIIVVSVLDTYRLLLHEREKELGTMRAIVFRRWEIIVLLLMEATILFILSISLGFVLARGAAYGASFLSFSSIASFEIFMQNGRLTSVYSLRSFLMNCGIVLVALLPAVFIPVYNATRRPLAEILSGGEK
jgi:putative ABC transport system permease protein